MVGACKIFVLSTDAFYTNSCIGLDRFFGYKTIDDKAPRRHRDTGDLVISAFFVKSELAMFFEECL
ncbi:hypothetical protein D3C87_1932920 [compost metagenome]